MSDVDESAREAQQFLQTVAETLGRLRRMEIPGEVTDASPAGLARKLDDLLSCLTRFKESLPPAGESPEDAFSLPEMFENIEDRVRPLANVTGGPGVKVDSGPGGIVIGVEREEADAGEDDSDMAFPVKVTEDSGNLYDPGSASTNCSFTYTVTSLSGQVLGTAMTPQRPRYQNTEYAGPGAWSYGLGFWDGGTFILYEVVDEIALTDTCE